MKKLMFLAFMFSMWVQTDAQKMEFWLDTGIKVQSGATMLYNSAIGDDDSWDYTFATSTKFGGKLGFNWNYTGITLDVLAGKTKGVYQGIGTADRAIEMSTVDMYLLFRNAKHKGYFEVGPKVSIVGDVKEGDKGMTLSPVADNLYESLPMSAVIGFGTYILGSDGRFSGILGLRFEYGFSDIITETGKADGMRHPVNYTGTSAATNPIFAGIVFEFNWGIGGVGQARCGEKSKFIWF